MATERLSGLDASFLYLETATTQMHVAFTAILDPDTVPGGYTFRRIRQHIHDRLPLAPVFQRRLVGVPFGLGHPVWADDPDFDIDNHVYRAALPSPGGIRELAELVADVVGRKLDRDHPLWEMWVVEGLRHGDIALIAKMHHCTVDGVSGTELLGLLLDLEPLPPAAGSGHEQPVEGALPSPVELVGQALLRRLSSPVDIARMAWRTGSAVLGIRRARQSPTGGKAALPLTAPRVSVNAAVTSRRRVAYAAVSLGAVKQLKDRACVTVNDVVLALATAALRAYLLAGDELPDTPLVAVVPVSVKPDEGTMHGANKVSAMFVPLPTDEPEPMRRLALLHSSTKGAKEEHKALGAHTLQNWVEHASPNVFALAARVYTRMRLAERHRPIANLVVSNVPGPDFPLYLGGAELRACFPLGPVVDGMGLNITIMSYRGVLYWGFVSCARAAPRLWDLAASVPEALGELLDAAGLPREPLQLAVDLDVGAGPPLDERHRLRAPRTAGRAHRPDPQDFGQTGHDLDEWTDPAAVGRPWISGKEALEVPTGD